MPNAHGEAEETRMVKRRARRPSPLSYLPSVDIPLMQPPIAGDVENADGGIGVSHTLRPLVVHIDRPANTPEGTFFELFWGPGDPVAFNLIREGDQNLTRIPFTVPFDSIREPWADPVYVLVIRCDEDDSQTKPLRLRVNLQHPGGQDPNPAPGNQRLVFELPDDVRLGGVSADRAKQGVEVLIRHWLNMAAYDLLILVWGSVRIERLIQPGEVGRDIKCMLDEDAIKEAGDSDLLPVAFQVRGPTGNYPDPWAPWSTTSLVSVYLATDRLDAPWVQTPETDREIDLEKLGTRDVQIGMTVGSTDARVYSHIFLYWNGVNAQGSSVSYFEDRQVAGAKGYFFNIDNALVTAIAQGSAVVYYELKGDGLPDKRSHNRYITVIGEIVTWPAPTVDQALEGDLDSGLPLITIRFLAQTSWASTDRVQVTILASDVGGTVDYAAVRLVGQIAPDGQVTFDVPGTELKRFDGRAIEVFYSVGRGNERPQESLRRVYQVQIPHELPVPKLIQATGSGTSVNLASMSAQDGATVEVRFLMHTTDSIKITMTGTAGAGSPVIAAKPGSTNGVVTFEIPKDAIAANIGNTNKTFTLKYEVTRGDVVRPSVVLTVTVTPIPASELAKTLIRINEANQTTKVLDLSSSTANRTLRIGTWPFITSGKQVWMELRGFKANGTAHNFRVWNGGSKQTNSTWLSQEYWQNAIGYASYLKELGHNKKLTLHFKAALRAGITEADAIVFPVVEYTVNTLPVEFPAPKLTQATGPGAVVTLAPMSALNGGTVEVRFSPMDPTDSIKIIMVGTAGAGSPAIAAKPGLTAGVVTFDIPKDAIAANIGNTNKTITLKYEVTRAGVVRPSAILTVTVTPIPRSSLPYPLINNIAHNGTLDVPNLPSNARLTIAKWPLQYSGMKIWLTYRCSGASPNPNVVWTGQQHHTDAGLQYDAPIAWLNTCPHGNEVWIDFKVAYDPNASEAGAVSFPTTIYPVKNFETVDSTDFSNGRNNWANYIFGNGTVVSDGPAIYWRGTGTGQNPCGLLKYFDYGRLVVAHPYRITFDFASTTNEGCLVSIRTVGTTVYQWTKLNGGSSWATHSFDFSPKVDSNSRRLLIEIMNYPAGGVTSFSIDNIKIIKL
jgi:hypothetical protein